MRTITQVSRRSLLLTLAALMAASSLAALAGPGSVATGQSVDVPIVADTYTATGNATLNSTNYGTQTYAFATSGANTSFLRFDTSAAAPAGMTLDSATIELRTTNLSVTSGGYVVHQAPNTWDETTLTYNNQPTLGAAVATSSTPASGAANYSYTALTLPAGTINQNGTTSFGVRYSTSGSNFQFSTREGNYAPRLKLNYVAQPAPTPQPGMVAAPIVADTYTATGNATLNSTNYGTQTYAFATSGANTAFLRFNTAGLLPAGAQLDHAVIKLRTTRLDVTTGGYTVYQAPDSWNETTLTYNNQPSLGALQGTSPTPSSSPNYGYTALSLPGNAVNPLGNTSLAIRYNVGGSNFQFSTREGSYAPILELHYVTNGDPSPDPDPDPEPSEHPFIYAAGDIACAAGYTVTGNACQHGATSDLLMQGNPAAVLPLGDIQYPNGELENFMASFDPTWGRVKSLMRPVPGNHEYYTPGAPGYYDYFNGVGNQTGQAGDRTKGGYYSYNIGNWHFIALNSECTAFPGGCGAGSPQMLWLEQDLAANSDICTVAYFHQPRFTSGAHNGQTAMTPIWNALVQGGVDIALSGHNHTFEANKPFGATTSTSQTPVITPNGIQSFIVGTGGKDLTGFTRSLIASDGSNAQTARSHNTPGILKLTLKSGSYDWEAVPVAGRTFANADSSTSGAFSGTGSCH